MLALEGVGRRYGARGSWVLRDVRLKLPRGALVRVEGRNGSGKSTLLRLFAGIDAPSAGRITGRPATAYVPERFAASLPFTAAGYLTHLGRVHGLSAARARARTGETLERFGIAEYAGTAMEALSKGTAQKVAVAQALLAEPELIVLDEAWTGLDTATRALLDAEVGTRVAAGTTVVFVDHDPARLAGAPTAVHRVEGTAVREESPRPAPAAAAGPAVLIVATRPGGPHPAPAALPSGTRVLPPAGEPGTLRLSVPAAGSDAALRLLLTADPPWHVASVGPRPAGAGEGER